MSCAASKSHFVYFVSCAQNSWQDKQREAGTRTKIPQNGLNQCAIHDQTEEGKEDAIDMFMLAFFTTDLASLSEHF